MNMTETQNNTVLLSSDRKKMTVIAPNGRRAVLRGLEPFSDEKVEEAASDDLFSHDLHGHSYSGRFKVLRGSVVVHLHRKLTRRLMLPMIEVDFKGALPPRRTVMAGWGRIVVGIGWCLALGLGLAVPLSNPAPAAAQPSDSAAVNPCGPDAHPVEMVIGCAPPVSEYDDWRDLITRGTPRG